MDIDDALLKKLIDTFQTELEEHLQHLTDALLLIEKGSLSPNDLKTQIDKLFRSAHNIKGTSRSMGIHTIGDIAHQLESLFYAIKNNTIAISPFIIDIGLNAIDGIRIAMQAFIDNQPLSFDLNDLIKHIQNPLEAKPQNINNQAFKPNTPPQSSRSSPALKEDIEKENETIRISLISLDHISTLMEKMQMSKIAIDDHYQQLNHLTIKSKQFYNKWLHTLPLIKDQDHPQTFETLDKPLLENTDGIAELNDMIHQMQKNLKPHINDLSILNNALQEAMRMLRLLPATTLTRTLPRIVRDLARELNKNVDLEIKGDEVKIDKFILESLKDPFIHLLRNAIDHGIESETLREQKKKNKIGKVSIHICQKGSQIFFTISDDGAGIDTDKIATLALNKNIITQHHLAEMNKEQILNLIFHPGFSTKETITNISGRGVGLDIVKANIEHLKGNINVETRLNQGSTFYLRLPLTLSSERGLLVKSGGQPFVIPTSDIERILMIPTKDIFNMESSQTILFNEHPIPLHSLADLLHLEKEPVTTHGLPLVIIKKGWQLVALFVEDIIGEREIVLKPLHEPLSALPGIAGGTLSSNGQVIIVLNLKDLMDKALGVSKTTRRFVQENKTQKKTKPHILVVDDSITTRTLEKNVLESKDYQVTVAVNGKEAWELLQKQKFSLLITDISMPIMNGFELTERIRKSFELQSLPVIIVTSQNSESEKQRGIDVGANAYLIKNEFESSRFLEIISQWV